MCGSILPLPPLPPPPPHDHDDGITDRVHRRGPQSSSITTPLTRLTRTYLPYAGVPTDMTGRSTGANGVYAIVSRQLPGFNSLASAVSISAELAMLAVKFAIARREWASDVADEISRTCRAVAHGHRDASRAAATLKLLRMIVETHSTPQPSRKAAYIQTPSCRPINIKRRNDHQASTARRRKRMSAHAQQPPQR